MKVTTIGNVTEANGILVSKGIQVLRFLNDTTDFVNEKIEISLVDFTTGKETVLLRKELLKVYAEVTSQGGNLRKAKQALIEVSDGRDLDLNAQKVLRINLYDLTAANIYTISAIESGIKGGVPVIFEQLITANGIKSQKFPISEGSLLVLPVADLNDIRIVYNDNTECRLDGSDLMVKAVATNGIIALNADNTIAKVGYDLIYIVDLTLRAFNENGAMIANKNVTEIEVNLIDGLGYTMYKVSNMDKAGFDWKF